MVPIRRWLQEKTRHDVINANYNVQVKRFKDISTNNNSKTFIRDNNIMENITIGRRAIQRLKQIRKKNWRRKYLIRFAFQAYKTKTKIMKRKNNILTITKPIIVQKKKSTNKKQGGKLKTNYENAYKEREKKKLTKNWSEHLKKVNTWKRNLNKINQ